MYWDSKIFNTSQLCFKNKVRPDATVEFGATGDDDGKKIKIKFY